MRPLSTSSMPFLASGKARSSAPYWQICLLYLRTAFTAARSCSTLTPSGFSTWTCSRLQTPKQHGDVPVVGRHVVDTVDIPLRQQLPEVVVHADSAVWTPGLL